MGKDDCRTNFVPFTLVGGKVGDELGGGDAMRTGMCRVRGWAGSGAVDAGDCHDVWFAGVACCCCFIGG